MDHAKTITNIRARHAARAVLPVLDLGLGRQAHEDVSDLLEIMDAREKLAERAVGRALSAPAAPSEPASEDDRERLGRIVREEWRAWAREQPSPKPSWLVPWEGLSEPDREVDRRIGERLFAEGRRGGDVLAGARSATRLPPDVLQAALAAATTFIPEADLCGCDPVRLNAEGHHRRGSEGCCAGDVPADIDPEDMWRARKRECPGSDNGHRLAFLAGVDAGRRTASRVTPAPLTEAALASFAAVDWGTADDWADHMILARDSNGAKAIFALAAALRASRGDVHDAVRPEADPAVQAAIRGLERVAPAQHGGGAEMAVTTGEPAPAGDIFSPDDEGESFFR